MEVGPDTVHYEPYIDIGDLLMLVIHWEDEEYGCHPTELEGALHHRGHKHALCDEFLQIGKCVAC